MKFFHQTFYAVAREFNLFLQTQLRWNQRKSVKTTGPVPSQFKLSGVSIGTDL